MLAEFSVTPLDRGGKGLGPLVAESLAIVRRSGLTHQLCPMGTVVEGSLDEVFAVIKACHENMLRHSERVSTSIKIDDRKGSGGRLAGKVASVEAALAEKG
ncbi:MAG: hypothetical protein A2284_18220 [Deltaproteobacteria bacterium RIFOXYA12_FULL_61_11]|nr:MAG: hypothetical protein A2284_18220 [Deltaproteobacteria bacterium RIFOXYA12_FULL_61_11]